MSPNLLRSAALAGLVLTPVLGCECDPVVNKVAPKITVDVCTKPANEPFDDCALPFGTADLSVVAERTFTISNPSSLELQFTGDGIDGIYFDEAGDQGFEFVNEPPSSIPAGLSAEVAVRIRPTLESTITKEIVIESDANNTTENDEGHSEIRIPITLTGVDNGVPDIEVVPVACGSADPLNVDFGRVATSGARVCNLTINNRGTRDLVIDSVVFVADAEGVEIKEPADSDAEPAIQLAGSPPTPEQPLGPTASNAPLNLRVSFSPDVLGRFSGVLRIASSDPDEATLDIPLVGIGVDAPTCRARVKSVNGEEVTGVAVVEPLDDVVIEADAAAATPDGSVTYAWEIIERGPGSGVVLSNPVGQETGFSFANRRGVDVAGTFKACVIVTDDLGTDSVEPCCVDFDSVPQDSFLVQLTWVGEQSDDMDLHVTKKSGVNDYCVNSLGSGSGGVDLPFKTCATFDCGYYNCRNTATTGAPEWDGVPGRTEGDPTLDIDDVDGFGPENINVDIAASGSYGFGASYFGGSIPVSMFIRLFLFGQLRGEWVANIEDDFFEVGIVHFGADLNQPCVEDLTDGNSTDDCPDFAP